MGLKEELQEVNDKSFNTWFDRWWDSYDLEKKMRVSASKGKTGRIISCDKGDDYTKCRLRDDRTVIRIKEKLEDVEVKRVIGRRNRLLGVPIETNFISITWDEED